MARGESVILVARTRPTDRAPAADVGFAQLYRTFSSVRLGASLILNDLYVIAEARRRGVGARLVDACTAYARTARVVSLQLETRPDNAVAMRLYVGKGFVADTEFARLSFPLELPVLSRSPAR